MGSYRSHAAWNKKGPFFVKSGVSSKERAAAILDKALFFPLVCLLIFAPTAGGAVSPQVYNAIEWTVFFLLFLFCIRRLYFSGEKRITWVRTPVNIFLVLLLIFIFLQIIPLPPFILSYLSPETYLDKKTAYDVICRSRDDCGTADWMTLSYYNHATLGEGLKVAAYLGMFFLVLNTAASRRKMTVLMTTIVAMGVIEAVSAYAHAAANRALAPSGTFPFSNHFAFYLEMAFCLSFGMMIAQSASRKRLMSGLKGRRAAVQRVISLFDADSPGFRRLFFWVTTLFLGGGIILTRSRGAIVATGAGIIFTGMAFLAFSRHKKFAVISLCLGLAVFFTAFFMGAGDTINKFQKTEGLTMRLYIAESMVPMILDYPAAGVGLGNFQDLYTRYVPADYEGGVFTSGHSHNDWLEAFAEIGVIGGLLLLTAYAVFIVKITSLWARRNDRFAVGVGAGVAMCMVSVGVHSFFDFSMHIPANPLTLAAVAGIGYAAVYSRRADAENAFFYKSRVFRMGKTGRICFTGCALTFLLCVSVLIGRNYVLPSPASVSGRGHINAETYLRRLENAVKLNPDNAALHLQLSRQYAQMRRGLSPDQGDSALHSMENALWLNPSREPYWYRVGSAYQRRKDNAENRFSKWLPMADACFDMVVRCAPQFTSSLFKAARYWIWRSFQTADAGGGGQDEKNKWSGEKRRAVEKFQKILKRAIRIRPDEWTRAVDLVWRSYPDDAVALGIIPEENEALKNLTLERVIKK